METKSKLTQVEVLRAIQEAQEAPYAPARASGCGRAYVCITDKAMAKMVKASCKTLGLIFTPKAYGVGSNAIYIGYDNADGRALGRSKVFAEVLNSHGISCYDDAACD